MTRLSINLCATCNGNLMLGKSILVFYGTERNLKDLMRNGYNATYGKIEMLTGDYSGFASVRIDKKNRLIFPVDESRVIVIACGSPYSDH